LRAPLKTITSQESEHRTAGDRARSLRIRARNIPGRIPFPRNSLKDALKIPATIWKENAGDAFDPILLARALGTTHRSSTFETLVKSAQRYGLTEGAEKAKSVALTELGRATVAPIDEKLVGMNLRKALLNPKAFEQFYNKYDRKNLPKEEILKTVLEREFEIPRPDVDSCYDVLMQNIT